MKQITFSLDAKSIQNAIKEVEQYKKDFEDNVHELRRRIAETIKWTAKQGFQRAVASDTFLKIEGGVKTPIEPIPATSIEVNVEHRDNISVVFTDVEEAVFIEYGAGVYYNGNAGDSPHPWGIEKGFVIGSYGQHKGVRNAWGYKDGTGAIILTHGTPAAMPMYRGAEEAIRTIDNIVREVFDG